MKKLIALAAVATCGAALAVESANIVGYQNKDLGNGYNFVVSTFDSISGVSKLGDIGVNANVTYGGTILQLLTDTGATATITDVTDLGDVSAEFYYVDATTAEALGVDAGWYLADDTTFEYCQNDRVIPYGQGVMLDCGDDSAALVFAGAVSGEAAEINLGNGFNFTGNCSPTDITLGDLAANANVTYGGTILQLLTDTGATATITDVTDLGDVSAEFYYVDATTAEALGVDAGWYLADDTTFEYCQNDRVIAAGSGFMLDCGDDDAAVIVPSAL